MLTPDTGYLTLEVRFAMPAEGFSYKTMLKQVRKRILSATVGFELIGHLASDDSNADSIGLLEYEKKMCESISHISAEGTGEITYPEELEIVCRYLKHLFKYMDIKFLSIPDVKRFNRTNLKEAIKLPIFMVSNHWQSERTLLW
jgi:hypothetical protein